MQSSQELKEPQLNRYQQVLKYFTQQAPSKKEQETLPSHLIYTWRLPCAAVKKDSSVVAIWVPRRSQRSFCNLIEDANARCSAFAALKERNCRLVGSKVVRRRNPVSPTPTKTPTLSPSKTLSETPTESPSQVPTAAPTRTPTQSPTSPTSPASTSSSTSPTTSPSTAPTPLFSESSRNRGAKFIISRCWWRCNWSCGTLSLGGNEISDQGAGSLADASKVNSTLTAL